METKNQDQNSQRDIADFSDSAASLNESQFFRWQKTLMTLLLAVLLMTPLADFSPLLAVPKASAQPFFGPELGEEPRWLDCVPLLARITGECVPITVSGDQYRTRRNRNKAIRTWLLIGVSHGIATWVAQKIDNKLKVYDYLGYVSIVSDILYKNRFLFEALDVPVDRFYTGYVYDNQYQNGGADFAVMMEDLWQKVNGRIGTAPINPNDPLFYLKLAQAGSYYSSPYDWYHNYNDKAFLARSQANQAAVLEVLTGGGYKGTRRTSDLQTVLQQKTIGWYEDDTHGVIPILTPGGYAARAIEAAMEKILASQHPYNSENVIAALVSNVVGGLLNGSFGVFRLGSSSLRESTPQDPGLENTNPGADEQPPATPAPVDTDGDGVPDNQDPAPTDPCNPDPNADPSSCGVPVP